MSGAVRVVGERLGVPAVAVAPALRGGHPVPVLLVLAGGEAADTQHAGRVLPAVPANIKLLF